MALISLQVLPMITLDSGFMNFLQTTLGFLQVPFYLAYWFNEFI